MEERRTKGAPPKLGKDLAVRKPRRSPANVPRIFGVRDRGPGWEALRGSPDGNRRSAGRFGRSMVGRDRLLSCDKDWLGNGRMQGRASAEAMRRNGERSRGGGRQPDQSRCGREGTIVGD